MNRSLLDVAGEVLCVSQFTLYGDARRGNRPSFVEAAPPDEAERALRARARGARGAGRALRRPHGGGARERRSRHADRRGLKPPYAAGTRSGLYLLARTFICGPRPTWRWASQPTFFSTICRAQITSTSDIESASRDVEPDVELLACEPDRRPTGCGL